VQVVAIPPTVYTGERGSVNSAELRGTQFTCFTGTQITCFTGTKVQILTHCCGAASGWQMLSYLAVSPYTGALPAAITRTLWAQHPVEVSMDAVRLSFMDSSVPPSLVLVALNGKRFCLLYCFQ
jgi:hypothetical protein